MLNCKYCNYFKSASEAGEALSRFGCTNFSMADSGEPTGICDYTGVVFDREIEELDIEYPCNSFEAKRLPLPIKVDEAYWKYNYIKNHKKAETKRVNKIA